MSFFDNTRKPEGLGGRLVVKMMNHGHAKLAKWGLSHVNPNGSEQILDAGCGGGANIAQWLKLCQKGTVVGLDYSDISVAASKKKNQSAIHAGQCQILCGDISKLPFQERSFDYVSAFETIYFWPELKRTFQGIHSVLKEGGTFIIVNECDGTNPKDEKWVNAISGMQIYKSQELTKLLRAAGFQKIQIHRYSKKHWICIMAQR